MNEQTMQALEARLLAQYGEARTREIEEAYALRRPVTLRVNALKSDHAYVTARLREYGIEVRGVGWYRDALIAEDVREEALRQTELYERGEIYLQSLSSMLPPLLVGAKEGESILDMTAAPGGKTTQLSALSGGRALITACERDRVRCSRLRFNVARQGAPRVTVLETDASTLDDFFRFDKILLDAPCSGSGTISAGKRTDFSEKLLRSCMRAQSALLDKALRLLKKGGTLVYSTCSVLSCENEEQVLRAVSSRAGAKLAPIVPFGEIPLLSEADGMMCVKPTNLYEGFFLAKIIKE